MTLPFLLGFERAADGAAVEQVLQQYTHTCGYTRAWQDSDDPLLIYLIPECPVDAVIESLKTNISNYVVAAYNNQLSQDMYERIEAIIKEVREASVNWLNQHTYDRIARFVSEEKRLHDLIVAELIAQGALA